MVNKMMVLFLKTTISAVLVTSARTLSLSHTHKGATLQTPYLVHLCSPKIIARGIARGRWLVQFTTGDTLEGVTLEGVHHPPLLHHSHTSPVLREAGLSLARLERFVQCASCLCRHTVLLKPLALCDEGQEPHHLGKSF